MITIISQLGPNFLALSNKLRIFYNCYKVLTTSYVEVTTDSNINWNDVIKKEARGSGDEDLGEVQEVGPNYVLVKKGILNKEKFYIPKDQVESYDGDTLRFRISEDEAKSRYTGEYHPSSTKETGYSSASTTRTVADKVNQEETAIPVTEERLGVSSKPYRKHKNVATLNCCTISETKKRHNVHHKRLFGESLCLD